MGEAARGIRAQIFRPRSGSCGTCGISDSELEEVTIVGPGIDEVFAATEYAPAVRLVKREVYGREIVHAEPVDKPAGMVGPMMGGCYVGTADSRITRATGIYGAIALHDRFETPAQYATYD